MIFFLYLEQKEHLFSYIVGRNKTLTTEELYTVIRNGKAGKPSRGW